MGKSIKRVILKEGAIFIIIAAVIYFAFSYLSPHMPVIVPKYKLVFADGKNYTIDIHPEISYEDISAPGRFLKTVQNPDSRLVSKRVQEFIKLKGISSPLTEAKCVNSEILRLANKCYSFLALNIFLKALIVYLFFLSARIIIWAVMTLRGLR